MVCLHCTKVVRPEPASGTTPYHYHRYHSYIIIIITITIIIIDIIVTIIVIIIRQGLTSMSAYLATFVKLGNSRKECLRDLS